MKLKGLILSVLAVSLGTAGSFAAKALPLPQDSPAAEHERGSGDWDAPPQEFREIQRQGFHDGVEGARKDFDHHRAPNVNNREEYRHPHVEASARDDYREGFRRGYERAMDHLMGH